MRSPSVSQLAVIALFAFGLAGAARAQTCPNSCVGAVDGPKQGVHSQFDGSADAILWPPNHKLDTIEISAQNAQGNTCNVTITNVAQDEPVTGAGSGNTSPDAANCTNAGNNSDVDLRAERSGTLQDGRYYNIAYTMDDPDCPIQQAMATALVLVPHDQGLAHTGTWVNEGPLYQSGVTCTP
jgi:hypothetical protein